jgi:hypothetical protein
LGGWAINDNYFAEEMGLLVHILLNGVLGTDFVLFDLLPRYWLLVPL